MTDNIVIPNPPKEMVALFSWLKDNCDKDAVNNRCIWVEKPGLYWATNPYKIVRALIYDTNAFVAPGYYVVETANSKLLFLVPVEDVRFPDVHSLWDTQFQISKSATPTFDPELLIKIAKPFGQVTIHTHHPRLATHLILKDPRNLPFGNYSAILMPLNIKSSLEELFGEVFTLQYEYPPFFILHKDDTKSWLEVDRKALIDLCIADKISEQSAQNHNRVYLVVGEDANKFIAAFVTRFGKEPELQVVTERVSPIREYLDYQKGTAQ